MININFSSKIIIKPKHRLHLIDFKELYEYRDLFFFLVLRDIKIRYKQTVLGAAWAIIQPLFTMIVFSLFFGKLAKMPSDNIPYPIFSYAALVPWTYFANAVTNSANSLVGNSSIISKIYFPRLVIPTSSVLAGLLDFFISILVLFIMMFYYGILPSPTIILLPALVILMMITATGVGLLLSALNVKYRDIKYTVPFLIQFWMFVTPIVYPVAIIPKKFHLLYGLNPMVGIIEGFRSVILGTIPFPLKMFSVSIVVSTLLLVVGLIYFRSMERYFADVI